MTRPTPCDVAAIGTRAEAATEGPWFYCPKHRRGYELVTGDPSQDDPSVGYLHMEALGIGRTCGDDMPSDGATLDFIAHARTDIPALLADLLSTRSERDALQEWANNVCEALDGGASPMSETARLVSWVGQRYAQMSEDVSNMRARITELEALATVKP